MNERRNNAATDSASARVEASAANEASTGTEASVSAEGNAPRSNRLVTIPNILCAIRLVGSFVLAGVALAEQPDVFLWLFVFLAATDWIDGKLAIVLNQRSVLGARLDSWADDSLYAGLLFGSLWLHGETLRGELPWIGAAIGSYALSVLAAFVKFGRWPSYHTRLAKTSWLLLTVGAISLLAEWSLWPLRVAMVSVTLANIEHLIITRISPEWIADAGSLLRVRKSLAAQQTD